MDTLEKINEYLEIIDTYYRALEGHNNLLDFLKREARCVDEGLNLINLDILPISRNYIEECRNRQRENFKKR